MMQDLGSFFFFFFLDGPVSILTNFTVLSGALFFYWVLFFCVDKQFSNYSSQSYGIVEIRDGKELTVDPVYPPCHWSLVYHNTMSTALLNEVLNVLRDSFGRPLNQPNTPNN